MSQATGLKTCNWNVIISLHEIIPTINLAAKNAALM